MRLTITPEEAKMLRTWLRVARDSHRSGPDLTYLLSNNGNTPANHRRYMREKAACAKGLAVIEGLLERLKPKRSK